jgi:hypothetical protein
MARAPVAHFIREWLERGDAERHAQQERAGKA